MHYFSTLAIAYLSLAQCRYSIASVAKHLCSGENPVKWTIYPFIHPSFAISSAEIWQNRFIPQGKCCKIEYFRDSKKIP